mmetsp:Transcript_24385/g.56202  ORF Transcript_24385/g.56202 Transcript_24385/m.56202 type:complete len:221 (-) Transcript_24385:1023-1685(-)
MEHAGDELVALLEASEDLGGAEGDVQEEDLLAMVPLSARRVLVHQAAPSPGGVQRGATLVKVAGSHPHVAAGRSLRRVVIQADQLQLAHHLGHEHEVIVVDPDHVVWSRSVEDLLGEHLVKVLVRAEEVLSARAVPGQLRARLVRLRRPAGVGEVEDVDVVKRGPEDAFAVANVGLFDHIRCNEDRVAVHRLQHGRDLLLCFVRGLIANLNGANPPCFET